jgi:hypothetical protein
MEIEEKFRLNGVFHKISFYNLSSLVFLRRGEGRLILAKYFARSGRRIFCAIPVCKIKENSEFKTIFCFLSEKLENFSKQQKSKIILLEKNWPPYHKAAFD